MKNIISWRDQMTWHIVCDERMICWSGQNAGRVLKLFWTITVWYLLVMVIGQYWEMAVTWLCDIA